MITTNDAAAVPSYSSAPEAHQAVAPNEIAVGVVIGRTSEYFDFFVYGIASVLVFPSVFFPFAGRLEGLLYAFTIFSFAFIARPFGTALFMTIQRHWGRSVKLTAALFLLGTATAGIAFLPGHAVLGGYAILVLSLLRILQGLALGGSWDGLPSLLALNAPKNRRSRFAMIGQLGAPIGFLVASVLFLFLYMSLSTEDFLGWGWRYPFFVAFAINVVALFARLRLVLTHEYTAALEESELEPLSTRKMLQEQGYNIFIGAFAALASYALFHLVTIFPLSWIVLNGSQNVPDVLIVQAIGAILAIFGTIASGWIAERIGKRNTVGSLAVLIGIFSLFTPLLMDGNAVQQDIFILVGFVLLGLSYGQASGTVTANFQRRFRYTGAALTSDFAWLFGAAFAPLVALGLSAKFGLAYVSVYLLSGVICTLLALRINKSLEAS
ncbi:MFS transporter [Alloalcanivorax xenomutans]|jgi:MFS family permease|uniref:MFS transporter n=1 Tax=Alloalcanivorax xenomutans TaxID=1094342 RepID=UPI0006D5BFB5|nr:MFS transporter [Alloalcanivorax xenomutans]KYZ86636.1 arabinose ABC transporter permease [Alcanivorax sp. KX64203]MBA4722621.1 MFS transporter [Alcanivorax sp.]PHS57593.1 MAG: MFS transporter [Alcanivorax sp.]WOA32435.1 MFS transporter [Alloalcanivorax xenomutans]CUR46569.1 MFS permease [Alloalcanivorax xenomutans]|tara:strand:- start:333 stop:1646 length:1314 start_codon:yes stop_codon:yes gene_type:complete